MGYLYKHIRLDTDEVFYIGIGGFNKREKEGDYKRAFYKNGRNNMWRKIINKTDYKVEIILDDLSFVDACEKEKEYIKLYGRINLKTGTLSNLTDGGEGSLNHIISEETKEKLRKAKSGKNHPMYNKHHSEETKLKISGNKKETYKGENNPFYGKTHSEKTKKKLSEINKDQIPVNRRKVMCIETGVIYNSVKETERILNIKHVSCVCSGKRKRSGGLTFKYVK